MSETQLKAYDAVVAPFKSCFERIQAVDANLQLAKFGVESLSKMAIPALPHGLYPMKYSVNPGLAADAQAPANYNNERFSADLRKDIENDFPELSASAAVGLWGALEDGMRQFCALWFKDYRNKLILTKTSRKIENQNKLEVRLNKIPKLDEDDQEEAYWEWCKRIGREEQITDVDRYDRLQEIMGVLPINLTRSKNFDLIELEAARHIIVHRSSRIDKKFKARCPSLNCILGDEFIIGSDHILRYRRAVYAYVTDLMNNVRRSIPEVINF